MASFLTALFSLSMWGTISRFYYDDKSDEQTKNLYSTVIYFLVIFLTITYTLLFFFTEPLASLLEVKKKYVILGIVISYFDIFFPHIIALFRVEEKAKKVAIIKTTLGIIGIILQVIFVITFQNKILGFLSAKLVASVLCFLSFWYFSIQYLTKKFDFEKLSSYLKYGLHSLPGDIAAWLINFADRFMLKKFTGNTTTGIYSVGYQLAQGQNIIQNSINKAYVPYVFNRYSNVKDHQKELNERAIELFALFTCIAALAIVFIKDFTQLFEQSYQKLIYFFPIVIFSYLLNGYKLIFHNPLSYKKPFMKYKSLIWIGAAFLNIILNYFLIQKIAHYGAAIATLCSFAFSLLLVLFLMSKAIKIKYSTPVFVKILLVSVIFSSLYLLPHSLLNILIKISFSALYFTILARLSNFDEYIKRKVNGIFTN